MAIAGDIVANLTANTQGWTSGLQGAITPLNVFATAVLGAAGVGIAKFTELGSQLTDMAARTGVSVEALSGLRFAAGQTDTSMESLQAGLKFQGKFMQQLAEGSRAAGDTLKQLGITTGELAGRSADERFLIFADRLSQIDDVGQRSAMAMKIFGKGAIDLLPLMQGGAAGITELTDEAARLGLIMSTENAAAAEAFGDSIDKLKMTGEALLINVVAPMIPLLTHVANGLAAATGENGDWISMLAKTGVVIAAVIVAVKAVSLAVQGYAKAQAFAQALSGPAGWATLAAGLAAAGAATYALNAEFETMNSTLPITSSETARVTSAAYELKDAFDSQAEGFDAASASASFAMKQELDAENALADAATAASEEINAAITKQAELGRVARSMLDSAAAGLRTSAEAAQAESQKIFDAWIAGGADVGMRMEDIRKIQTGLLEDKSGFTDSLTNVSDELRVLRGEITETELKFEEMAKFGVSDGQIQKLREAMAERDALLQQQEIDKLASQEPPPLPDLPAEPVAAEPARRKAVLTEAITVRSDAGQRQLVELLNRKGGNSPEAMALKEAKKQTDLAVKSKEALDQIAANTAKPQLETKPFRGTAG